MDDTVGRRLAEKAPSSTRQVRLTLQYVSVWSATKISFLCGVGLGILGTVSLLLLWVVLNQLGVFTQLSSVLSGTSAGSSSVAGTIGISQALGIAVLFGTLNTIGTTFVGIVGAALYNLGVRITGGTTVGFSSES
jgi:hypothetical protein